MAFSIPNGPSNNGPDNNGFGTPAPHDPFTRRMTDAEQFNTVKYLFGNGPTFGQRDPKVEAVARRQLSNDIYGGTSRRPSFGQPGGMNTPSSSNLNGGTDFGQSGSSFGTPGAPTNSGFGTPPTPSAPSQTFNQQGRMADSFVAEHNARQQNAPGFGGQSFGQSFGQPRNDGPQMSF